MSSLPRTRRTFSASPSGRGTVMGHLAAAEPYVRLAQQANRLQQLQTLLDAGLPAYLQPGTHVANLKRGKIIIHADSGAVAVKLRQMAPRLADLFVQQGHEVTGIEVRVQARHRSRANGRNKPGKQLGSQQKQVLTSLSDGLTEGSALKRALERLLRNSA